MLGLSRVLCCTGTAMELRQNVRHILADNNMINQYFVTPCRSHCLVSQAETKRVSTYTWQMLVRVTRPAKDPLGANQSASPLLGGLFKEEMAHADTCSFIVVLLTLETPVHDSGRI